MLYVILWLLVGGVWAVGFTYFMNYLDEKNDFEITPNIILGTIIGALFGYITAILLTIFSIIAFFEDDKCSKWMSTPIKKINLKKDKSDEL